MKQQTQKKNGLLSPKIEKSDIITLGHGLCEFCGALNNKNTSQNTLHSPLIALTMIDPATGLLEIVKVTNKAKINILDLFHNTCLARYSRPHLLSLTMGMQVETNSNVSSNKCVTILAFKPNKLQITTINPQANAIIERVHKILNDILRSFYLENYHENLE
jgi:hypothetical protein